MQSFSHPRAASWLATQRARIRENRSPRSEARRHRKWAPAQQTLIQHDEYFPSGELWKNESDSIYELAQRFTFNGKDLDISTGLYDFGARSYDARQGQWLSPDPAIVDYVQGELHFGGIYNPGHLTAYGFVLNNPVKLRDPNGRQEGFTLCYGGPAACGVGASYEALKWAFIAVGGAAAVAATAVAVEHAWHEYVWNQQGKPTEGAPPATPTPGPSPTPADVDPAKPSGGEGAPPGGPAPGPKGPQIDPATAAAGAGAAAGAAQSPPGKQMAQQAVTVVQRVVNSKMGHAVERAVLRAGFETQKAAREALQKFGTMIEKNGLPAGTVKDANGHLVVPGFGDGGAVVYRQDGAKLTLQTVVKWVEGKGTPVE